MMSDDDSGRDRDARRRRGSKNSQAKGLESDDTLESHSIGTEEAALTDGGNLSGKEDRGTP